MNDTSTSAAIGNTVQNRNVLRMLICINRLPDTANPTIAPSHNGARALLEKIQKEGI